MLIASLRPPEADPDTEIAKQVILDIIAAKGGRFAGKTLLYKAFYLAHLYYWRDSKGLLTGYPIVRMPKGPGIDRGDDLIHQLIADGRIVLGSRPVGPYEETVFALADTYRIDPSDPRHQAVVSALEWIGDKTAKEVCELIHEFSRSWQQATDGAVLPIYIDLLSEEEYRLTQVAGAETDELFRAAFGGGV